MADQEMGLEDQKKLILPFMQRAQEVEKADLKVAYYCRLHAVEQAVTIPRRAKEVNAVVAAALSRLEKDKALITLDKEQDKVHCEAFALRVFANADRADRLGKSDLNTSKAFYAASCFIDVLNQFGPLDGDLISKQKYALWRAAEIRKAAREGRAPAPPPSAGEPTMEQLAADPAATDLLPSASMAGIKTLGGDVMSGGSMTSGISGTTQSMPSQSRLGVYQGSAQPSQPSYSEPQQSISGLGNSLIAAVDQRQGDGDITLMPSAVSRLQGAPVMPGQRYKPGCPVLFCESAGVGAGAQHQEIGTVGQVTTDEDGLFRYRVALRDRIEDANDMQIAPYPAEGAPITFLPHPTSVPVPATTTLVNDGMGWPPTYLVKLPDGTEMAAQAHQLSMLNPEETSRAQALVHGNQQQQHHQHQQYVPGPDLTASSAAYLSNTHTPQTGQNGLARSSYTPPHSSAPPPAPPAHPQQSQHFSQHNVRSGYDSSFSDGSEYSLGQRDGSRTAMGSTPPSRMQPAVNPPSTLAAGPAGYISIPALAPGHKPSVQAINEAQKAARTAVSSLNFEDAASAVKYLTHALEVLSSKAPPSTMAAGPAGYISIPALALGHKPSVQAINEAQKAARTAVSSLNFEDAASAVKYLTHALEVLTAPANAPVKKL